MLEEKKIVKICKKHGALEINQVKQELSHGKYLTYRCHQCKIEKNNRYTEKNREILVKKNMEYKKNNRQIVRDWTKQDREKYPEKYKAYSATTRKNQGASRTTREICRVRGISEEHYIKLLSDQEYVCAICNLPESRKNRIGEIARLCLDHDHKTGKIRQFLCHNCNTMLGKFNENIDIIKRAIIFLKNHGDICQ